MSASGRLLRVVSAQGGTTRWSTLGALRCQTITSAWSIRLHSGFRRHTINVTEAVRRHNVPRTTGVHSHHAQGYFGTIAESPK